MSLLIGIPEMSSGRHWLWRPLNGACFDQTRSYRYQLWRTWNPFGNRVLFVMLNPSSADEIDDDPTIRRCVAFAKAWGFGGMEICNIFAYRSSKPIALLETSEPVGTFNDIHIERACKIVEKVILAWGAHQALRRLDKHGLIEKRERKVKDIISLRTTNLYCLKRTAEHYPSHPLYLRSSLKPRVYA